MDTRVLGSEIMYCQLSKSPPRCWYVCKKALHIVLVSTMGQRSDAISLRYSQTSLPYPQGRNLVSLLEPSLWFTSRIPSTSSRDTQTTLLLLPRDRNSHLLRRVFRWMAAAPNSAVPRMPASCVALAVLGTPTFRECSSSRCT